MRTIPEDGEHMLTADFKKCVVLGYYNSYDGGANYATDKEMFDIPVDLKNINETYSHVVWFGK